MTQMSSMKCNLVSLFYRMRYDDICSEVNELKNEAVSRSRKRKGAPLKLRTENGCTLNCPIQMANHFNDYFSSIASNLFPPAHPDDDVRSFGTITRNSSSFFLDPIN